MSRAPLVALVACLVIACDAPAAPPPIDAALEDAPPTCEGVAPLTLGDPDGHAAPLAVGPGEARAGRLSAADLPADPRGLFGMRAGDFVLANEHIAVVIEAARVSDDFNPHGGQIAGVATLEAAGLARPGTVGEPSFTFGSTSLATEAVTVLDDGADGSAAIVRATGRLAPLGFLSFVGPLLGGAAPTLDIALDNVLPPGERAVIVRATIANDGPRAVGFSRPLLTAVQRNRMPMFAPGPGFTSEVGRSFPYVAFVEDRGTGYALEAPDAEVRVLLEQANLLFLQMPAWSAAACAHSEHVLGRVHVGGPGLDELREAIARGTGVTLREVSGVVRTSDGAPAALARVYAEDAAGTLLSRASTREDGSFALHVETSDPITLRAWRRGEAPSATTSASAPARDIVIALGATGALDLTIEDASGAAISAKVVATPIGSVAYAPPDAHGEHAIVRGADAVEYAIGGRAQLRVPAGPHRIVVSRGFEYEIAVLERDVLDGETLTETVRLDHTVPTPGVMCGDFHIHTHRSFDAEDDARLKVRAAAAEHLEIPLRSEHEYVASFDPLIAELGLERELYAITSLELTTFVYGHFGVFPLDVDASARNAGAVEWVDRSPPEVLGDAASRMGRFGRSEVIINHPRAGIALLGYFDAIGFDANLGRASRAEWWWDDVALLEVWNDSDYDANDPGVVRDWVSLLAAGRRVFGIGSSDSHEVARTFLGYPRTCLELGLDTPDELRAMGGASLVRDRALAGASYVVGGVFVDVRARGDVGPGGTVTGAGDREALDVVVRAASWVDVDRLRVFVDGALVSTAPIGPDDGDPLDAAVRLRATLDVSIAPGGSFVYVVADGEDDLEPVYPGRRPFGVTNPIFFTR